MKRLSKHILLLVGSLIFFGCSAMDLGADRDATLPLDDDSYYDSNSEHEADTNEHFDSDWIGESPQGSYIAADDIDGFCNLEMDAIFELFPTDSNATASPVLVRNALRAGVSVEESHVRINEFLNYYNFGLDRADPGDVNLSAEMQRIDGTDQFHLQIGVTSEHQTTDSRRNVNLVLSVDNSGSMSGTPMSLVQDSCLAIGDSLKAGDTISIANWDTEDNVILEKYTANGPGDGEFAAACNSLTGTGIADLHIGLETAYGLAEEALETDRINRVIVLSDGLSNLGLGDAEMIRNQAEQPDNEHIFLIGVGIGSSVNYRDLLMESLTDAGKGPYLVIDSKKEADQAFGEQFITHMEVAALDVSISLKLPPTLTVLPGYDAARFPANGTPGESQYLAPNDSMIFFNVLESCDVDQLDPSELVELTVKYTDRGTMIVKNKSFSAPFGTLLESNNPALIKGDAVVSFAQTVKEIGQAYSDEERSDLIGRAHAKIDFASAALGSDPEIDELAELLGYL